MYRYLMTTLMIVLVLMLAACGTAPEPAAPVADEAPAEEEMAAEEDMSEEEDMAEEDMSEEEPAADEEMAEEEMTGEAVTYVVDTDASTVNWEGSSVVGTVEEGTINISEGSLSFDGTTLTEGTVIIDMATMESTNLSGDMADRLIGHLQNEDFFEIETYPTSTLVIKSAEPTDVENQYEVTADLTIKGITHEIVYLTDVTVEDTSISGTADITFDRVQWDVVYNSGSIFDGLGDNVINDEVNMQVMLVANLSE